jgi:hypothetical protein
MLLVPAAMAGLAACTGGGSGTASASASASADKALTGAFSGSDLKGALLTKVNGVGSITPATSGRYSSLSAASTGKLSGSAAPVTPKACSATAQGFDPGTLSAAQAAAVSFKVSGNGVSEVLIASTAANAATALAAKVPAQCATYEAQVDGKTVTYDVTQKTVAGIGKQARELNVRSGSSSSDNLWSLIYRGTGFVGTVTVTGPNASEAAVEELGQQAYAFAAKSLP